MNDLKHILLVDDDPKGIESSVAALNAHKVVDEVGVVRSNAFSPHCAGKGS